MLNALIVNAITCTPILFIGAMRNRIAMHAGSIKMKNKKIRIRWTEKNFCKIGKYKKFMYIIKPHWEFLQHSGTWLLTYAITLHYENEKTGIAQYGGENINEAIAEVNDNIKKRILWGL